MASPVNRTPLEKMFAQCDRDNQKLITTANVKFVSDFIEKKGIHFAYDMSSFLREKATKAGISLNPQPFLAHSHPFCKTLENHFLLDVLPSLLGNSKWIFSSIKQNKIDSFIRKANSVDNNIDLINKCICARDFGRYSVEPNLADHQVNYLSKEARFPKNYMRSFHRACIFIHDEVHHWSVNEMIDFLEFCKPKRLIFTVVYPPELLLKINESQNPEAYKFKIIDKKFHFFPDGCCSEGYEQQIDLNWLMRGSYINTNVGTFTIKRVKSILAHHMFEIVPGRRATESTRFFSDFDTIDMSVLQLQRWKFQHHVPIRKVILKKIYDYLLCLKKPDVESAEAKLRQIIGDNEDCRISTFFLKFAKDIINRNKSNWDLYGVSLLNGFKDSMLSKLPVRIQKAFRRWGDNNLFEFLFTLDTLSVEVKTTEIKRNWFHDIIAECVDNDVMKQSLPECIDDLWFGFDLPQRKDNRLEPSPNKVLLWNKSGDPSRIGILEKNYWDRKSEMDQDSFLKKIERMRFKIRFNHFSTCDSWIFRMIYKLKPSSSFLQWSSEPSDRNDFNPYGIEVSDHLVEWDGYVKITLLSCSFFDDHEIKVSLFSNLCLGPGEEEEANSNQAIEDLNDVPCTPERSCEKILDHPSDPPCSNEAEHLVVFGGQTAEASSCVYDTSGSLEDLIISEENKLACLVMLDVVTSDIPLVKKKTVGDGNCFYRSLLISHGKDQGECSVLKTKLMNAMRDLGVNERVVTHFEGEGIFADQIVVFAFVIANKCNLFIQERGGSDGLLRISLPHLRDDSEIKEIYIERDGLHFNALIPDYAKIFERDFLMSEGAGDFSKLNSFLNEIECSRVTKLRGRQAYFFTDSDADYAHNKIKYAVNHVTCVEDLLPEELRSGYNSMLVQIFSEGAEIGLHRDNERCYDDGSILSINLKGSATFLIENGDLRSVKLTDGMWLRMNAGFQKKFRHGVTDCSNGRVNVTFRKHIRKMNGTPLVDTVSEAFSTGKGNACLIEAIAEADGQSPVKVFKTLVIKDKSWMDWIKSGFGGSMSDMIKAATQLSFSFDVFDGEKIFKFSNDGPKFNFDLLNGHWSKTVSNRHGMLETSISSELIKASDESPLLTRIHESNVLFFTPSAEAAASLKNSFLRRTTGVLLSEVYGDNFNCLKDFEIKETNEQFKVEAICGFAGSGKSRSVQSLIKTVWRNLNFLVISPRANLKDDWIEKACCKKNWVKTFEIAMAHDFSKTDLIIVDELTLFPNGYLDLLLFKLKGKRKGKLPRILCLFDPLQARYHSDLDSSSLFEMHECDRLIKGETVRYLMQSMRLNEDFFGTFFPSIKLLGDLNKPFSAEIYPSHTVAIARSEDKNDPIDCILVASRDEKKALGCKLPVMTFGESQGLTFKRVCIVLSEYSEKQDVFRQIVALTRARESVCFACIYRGGIAMYLELNKGSVFSMFIRSEPFSARRMEICAGCSLEPIETKFGKGYDEVDREERLEGDPFIKPFICLAQRVNSEDVELIEPEVVEPKGQAHLCIAQSNFALARNFDLIRAKELREFRIDMEETNQFCHDYNRLHAKGRAETAGPLRFESIFPRHRNEDNLTFWMAVHKRLRFSDEATERAKLKEAGGIGALLYNNFKEKLGLDFVWDQNLLDECVNDFETKKLSKSKAVITNHAPRSDIDWDMNSVFLFMKNQLCTKFEKQYVDAKAGQTLACFQHLILVKFAPYCRYMEKMLRSRFGENIYIHSNRNFDDLNNWVKKFYTGEMCIESDYEAFDASQDEYILSFELHLMEDMGMPRWFINDYVDLKCTLGCKLGHFAIMRFTGEFCTFLFNTLANMAFTYARYDISRDDPIAFAGDDMCMLVKRDVKPDFDEIFEKISLKAKVMLSERPMFCGWNLSQHGIVKEPELVYNRFKIAEERGNVDECIENYAIEVSYAYSLGEKLYDVLKREEQIEYHQAVVRFIVKNLDKLKTCVKDLFADQIRT